MARKPNLNKKPISTRVRVRMHRERTRMKRERQRHLSPKTDESAIAHQNSSVVPDESSPLEFQLRNWVNSYRVPKRAVDSLLGILNSHGMNSVPKNHRTLLQTPVNVEITEIAGGKLWYNRLANCLTNIFSGLDRDVSVRLNFNIDGLPLYNSSKISFWPILASIHGMCVVHDDNEILYVV